MGLLEQSESGRRYTLGGRCLLGRHAACDIRVNDARVSGEHASLHWVADHWELKDLGSRNGTFLEGRRLLSDERATLQPGQSFRLGSQGAAFRLLEAGPPAARARHLASGLIREASGALLVLPNDEFPLASLFQDALGRWVVELGEGRRVLEDQERLMLGQEEWVVELPTSATATLNEEAGIALAAVHLRIGVSRDEEHVEIEVGFGGQRHVLPVRSYHYLLATLARTWLAEHSLPEADRGWVDRDELCRMLATDANKLNVDIHRVRKQFGALGVQGAGGVVERRPDTTQVRLGIHSVEVFTL